ncbi:helix-turn-helix domain-containing protein [Kribbella sp. NPDC000426]|uniref:helix-turn-helix domain-containing protein n=1 Tax=Kribbella sp. NPDC000426 TaxID=3154255 RepID=UPI003328F3F0
MSDFGTVLRKFRRTAGLSQEKLASASGISVEAIKALEAGKRRSPRPLTLKLLADGLGLAGDERAELVAAGTQSRTSRQLPGQLPDDLEDFSGRDEQIADVEKLFSSGEERQGVVVISAIAGMGGVGKTALGVHVAHRVAAQFPDGQLYLNLRGFGPGEPMVVAEALGRLMGSLGVQTDVSDVDELASRYRSALAGRRVFVLLDNAANEAQVLPLLPGTSTCAVLITSRRSLTTLPGAAHLALDALPEPDARSLLAQVVGDGRIESDPVNAEAIVRLCGGLPLALRIAGARLAAQPSWSVEYFAERLGTNRRRLDELTLGDLDVRMSIEVSLAAATEQDAGAVAAFGLLGLHDGEELDVRVAARLLDLPVAATEELLEQLVDLHLLESSGPRRYQFHDLLRAYAQELAAARISASERLAARDRVVALYVAMAWRTRMPRLGTSSRAWFDEQWLAGSEGLEHEEVMAWLDAEADQVLAAAGRLTTGPWPDLTTLVRLAAGMVLFWADRQRNADGARLGELAVAALHRDPSCAPSGVEASIRHNLAQHYGVMADFERAAAHMRVAVELSGAPGSEWMLIHSLFALAQFLERLDRLDEGMTHAETGLELALKAGDEALEGQARFTLGVLAGRLGRPDEQDREFELAATLVRVHEPTSFAWLSRSIGDTYLRCGRPDSARNWLRTELATVKGSCSPFAVADHLQLLGAAEVQSTAYAAARGHLEEALALIGENSRELEVRVRASLGDALSGLGATELAEDQWRLVQGLRDQYGLQ